MRACATLFSLTLLVACGGADDAAPAAEGAPAQEAAPAEMAETGATLADFAGTWQTMATLEGTPDPVATTMRGSADGSDWMLMLEGRDPVALTASIRGDSLVLVSEPYESVLRDGVTVTVRTAGVVTDDGRMVGNMVATYQTPEGEQIVPGTIEGTREGM